MYWALSSLMVAEERITTKFAGLVMAAGTRRDRNNIRNRLLAPVIARADGLLSERGQRPLPRLAAFPRSGRG